MLLLDKDQKPSHAHWGLLLLPGLLSSAASSRVIGSLAICSRHRGSQTFWSQDLYIFLKMIEDRKVLLFMCYIY